MDDFKSVFPLAIKKQNKKIFHFSSFFVLHIVVERVCVSDILESNVPVHGKPMNLEFRPGQTQTGLYSHRRWLEA